MNIDDFIPVLFGHLENPCRTSNAGIVYQDIHLAEFFHGPGHHGFHFRLLAHMGYNRYGCAAFCLDQFDSFLLVGQIDPVHHNRSPFLGEFERDPTANTST